MLDRQKVEAILMRRFPGAGGQQIAAAANAIMGLEEEWVEIVDPDDHLAHVTNELQHGAELRLFRRRDS